MLEESDIKKLSEVFITRADLKHESAFINKQLMEIIGYVRQLDGRVYRLEQDIVTKEDFDTRIDALATGIDVIAGSMSDLRMEYVAIKTQLNRHEERLVQLEQ